MINDTRLTILLEWNKKKGKIRFTEKNIIDIFPREFFRFLHLFVSISGTENQRYHSLWR